MFHYKIPDPQFEETVWELTERRPTHAYVPIDGKFHLKKCSFRNEEAPRLLDEGWQDWRVKKLQWSIKVTEGEEEFDGWKIARSFTISTERVSIVRTDAKDVDHIILIRTESLQEVKPNFIENKFNIPIKPCRVVSREAHPIVGDTFPNGEKIRVYCWCEVHDANAEEGHTACERAIPREYLPCDIESDQGGTYCNTHGSSLNFESFCEDYKGPTELVGKVMWFRGETIIPWDYQSCTFLRDYSSNTEKDGCYTHESNREPGKPYCGKYDGPLRIIF